MADDPWGLVGKVVTVTGAASGIGRGIALGFGAAGAAVGVLDHDGPGAATVAAEIIAAGGKAIALPCDVTDAAAIAAAADAVQAAFGPCTVLVNNAGILRPGALATLPLALWNQLLSVNLTGYFLCAQTFGAQMRAAGGGSLVHIASIAAAHPTPLTGAYSVAKAGVAMLSKQLALEWADDNIRSNVVNPGMILTALSRSIYDRPGVTEARVAAIPSRRIGAPDDVADTVLFLASPRSGYVNGAEITVDGGFTRNVLGLIPRAGY
ncbi:MAG: SDR family NAD(P)-dependent oxidoreductase [Gemmobacter sp.]|nr:SDR family NAD(P)-dependent oxidoreductase [Gemmobacter sp.]